MPQALGKERVSSSVRQPLLRHGYGGWSYSLCGYSCTLCTESFESLESFGMEPVVLSSIPIVVLMMILDYEMNYNADHFNYITHYYLS